MFLSDHFTLQELTASDLATRQGWDNTPPPEMVINLTKLAQLLEQVRRVVKAPIFVTSGYRSLQLNRAIGSKDTSQHRSGCAADFKVPGMAPKQIIAACIAAKVPFDQIILEFDSWTHISFANSPRVEALIIDSAGTRFFK